MEALTLATLASLVFVFALTALCAVLYAEWLSVDTDTALDTYTLLFVRPSGALVITDAATMRIYRESFAVPSARTYRGRLAAHTGLRAAPDAATVPGVAGYAPSELCPTV